MPKEFQCTLCDCSYEWKTGLQKHFRQKHSGQVRIQRKEYLCSCGREFSAKQSIENHLKKVDGWKCSVCFYGCHTTKDQIHCSSSPTLERVNEDESELEDELQPGMEDEEQPGLGPQGLQQQPVVSIFPPIGPIDDEMIEYSQESNDYDKRIAALERGEFFIG
jgi:hypothetical protein